MVAPPNLLRGPATDGPYLASYLRSISGPIVLVAHSYGGFVATNAATGIANVKALVYIDAFMPDEGETAGAPWHVGFLRRRTRIESGAFRRWSGSLPPLGSEPAVTGFRECFATASRGTTRPSSGRRNVLRAGPVH